jgi:hypothetical protein
MKLAPVSSTNLRVQPRSSASIRTGVRLLAQFPGVTVVAVDLDRTFEDSTTSPMAAAVAPLPQPAPRASPIRTEQHRDECALTAASTSRARRGAASCGQVERIFRASASGSSTIRQSLSKTIVGQRSGLNAGHARPG